MPPRDLVYVGHMLDMARKAISKVDGVSRSHYDEDEDLRLALTHLVQVIGEAAGRVSREFCDANPEIPWTNIVGMRHKIVHDYLGVDEDIVWQVVTRNLPAIWRIGGAYRDSPSSLRAVRTRSWRPPASPGR